MPETARKPRGQGKARRRSVRNQAVITVIGDGVTRKQQVGRWGEQLAEAYLIERGCVLVARNARTPYGEIDRIVEQDGVTVFVEVKTRTSLSFGLPEEAITARKREHLLQSAEAYLQSHPELEGDWRVDVIAIEGRPGQSDPKIVWFENAVT